MVSATEKCRWKSGGNETVKHLAITLEFFQCYLGNLAEHCKERKARSGLEVKKLLGLPMWQDWWLGMIQEKKMNPKPTMKTGGQEASGSQSNLTEYPPELDAWYYWEERMNSKMLLNFLVTCEIILISQQDISFRAKWYFLPNPSPTHHHSPSHPPLLLVLLFYFFGAGNST